MAIHLVLCDKKSDMILKTMPRLPPVTRRIRKVIQFVAMVGLVAATTLQVGFAASSLDFTGKYVHKGQKGNSDIDPEVTLEVAQKNGAVEITREELGAKTTNRYALDNSEGDCLTPGDITGKCKARLKGKSLIVESVVLSDDHTSGNPVHVRTTQDWQLSSDAKTLTIRLYVDIQDRPSSTGDSKGQSSDVEKYTRE